MGGCIHHNMYTCLIAFFLLMLIVNAENQHHEFEKEHEFMYLRNSSKGPDNWGHLKQEWDTCGFGKFQSPIDITPKTVQVLSDVGKLGRKYRPAPAVIKNRGHDIMVEWKGKAGSANLSGVMYDLQQCHWHTPSEHTIQGRRYDLEMHMVHNNSEGQTAVIAILYEFGHPDPFLNKVIAKLNSTKGENKEDIDLGVVNPWEIKFGSRKYFRYLGSLTVPPCTQGVLWTLLKKVRTASKEQIRQLRRTVHHGFEENARPLQPLNDRSVYLYRPQLH